MVYGICMLYRIWCIEPVEPPWLARGGSIAPVEPPLATGMFFENGLKIDDVIYG